jgi:hypothetical protein
MDLNLKIPQTSSDTEINQIYTALRVLQRAVDNLYSNRFITGTSTPDSSSFEAGDVFMNTSTGELLKKNSSGWALLGTVTITT